MRRILPVFLLLTIALSAYAESADELNVTGLQLYRQKKYSQARRYFSKAIEADETHAWAHYNLACTLGVLRRIQGPCESNAYKSAITHHLEKAVSYNPSIRKKFPLDTDLDPVQDTYIYQRLTGADPETEWGLYRLLANVTWYGPAPGAFGPMSGIDFNGNGRMNLWTLHFKEDQVQRRFFPGRYSVKDGKIIIILDSGYGEDNKREFQGQLKGTTLTIDGFPGPFTDNPDECSA